MPAYSSMELRREEITLGVSTNLAWGYYDEFLKNGKYPTSVCWKPVQHKICWMLEVPRVWDCLQLYYFKKQLFFNEQLQVFSLLIPQPWYTSIAILSTEWGWKIMTVVQLKTVNTCIHMKEIDSDLLIKNHNAAFLNLSLQSFEIV